MSPLARGAAGLISRPERLLPLACVASAGVLALSEFLVAFEISEPVQGGVCELGAGDRHGYALLLLAAFAVIALGLAIAAATRSERLRGTDDRVDDAKAAGYAGVSRVARIAVAVAGGIALTLFLTIDLPDATATGTTGNDCTSSGGFSEADFVVDAEVIPRAGFWLELVGALGLAVSGVALATLTTAQLTALRSGAPPGTPGRRPRPRPRPGSEEPATGSALLDQAERMGDEVAGEGEDAREPKRGSSRAKASARADRGRPSG